MPKRKLWFVAVLAATLFAAVLMKAQSGRTYSVGLDWWSAGRGFVFPLAEDYDNPLGQVRILNSKGMIHPEGHAFFQALGSNGRACITCHQPAGAMSVAADRIRQRWADTGGTDPIFASIDGANCPDLNQADPKSHSLLLHRGLFRMVLPWPPKGSDGAVIQPDFRLEVLRDPTGCNTSKVYGLDSPHPSVSVFRRPRVVANFKFALAEDPAFALMADGREPSLRMQAITAALVHEQSKAVPTKEQLDQIVAFEMQIFAAQSGHIQGGLLNELNGPSLLGPENLALGKGGLFSGSRQPTVTSAFILWKTPASDDITTSFRSSVARGSELFAVGCGSCHQAGIKRAMNIGTTNPVDPSQPDELPVFRISCNSGQVLYSEDPGRALATGRCADVGAVVMQQLRGLSARAPYFANGSAQSLGDVVEFYNRRFTLQYSDKEKQDLVNFLSVL